MAKASKAQKPSAKIIDGNKSTEIPIEEMQPQLPAIIEVDKKVLTPDEQAQVEVAKFDIARSWIAEKKEAYSTLTILDVNDKAGYKAVEAAWQEIRNKRLAVEKKHKELKAGYLVVTRAIDGEKNDLVNLLLEVENTAGDKLETIDKLIEEEKTKAEREAQAKLHTRINNLIDMGMKFTGSYYTIGDTISIDAVVLKSMVDEDYQKLADKVQAEAKKIADAIFHKSEEERIEREKIEAQRLENERVKQDLDRQQKEYEQLKLEIENDKKQMLTMRTNARSQSLEALGMSYNFNHKYFSISIEIESKKSGVIVMLSQVEETNPDDWDFLYKKTFVDIEELNTKRAEWLDVLRKKEAEEEAEKLKVKQELEQKEMVFKAREIQLINEFGMKLQGTGAYTRTFNFPGSSPVLVFRKLAFDAFEEDWIVISEITQSKISEGLNSERIYKLKMEEQKELDRVAALSDVEKVNEYIKQITLVNNGKSLDLKNTIIREAVVAFDNQISFMIEELLAELTSITNQ